LQNHFTNTHSQLQQTENTGTNNNSNNNNNNYHTESTAINLSTNMTPTSYSGGSGNANSASATDKIITTIATPSSSSSFIDTSIFTESADTAELLNNALENDLIDLTSNAVTKVSTNVPADDLFTADIDFMNNYLKSLPDYSNVSSNSNNNTINNNCNNVQQIPSNVKLREHPNPKPFQNSFTETHVPLHNQAYPKHGVSQSPQFHRKPVRIPLSKSNSIHTITKQNMNMKSFGNNQINCHEKESACIVEDVQNNNNNNVSSNNNNKISRSTSSNSMINANDPNVGTVKEGTDFMGFMRKPSSLMNIFKKLGGSHSNSFSPQQHQQQQQVTSHDHDMHKSSKTPSVEPKKSISDFWRDNVSSTNQHTPKFGWNYHKIIPQFNHKSSQPQSPPIQQPQQVAPNSTKPFPSPSSAKRKMNVTNKKTEPAATISNSSSVATAAALSPMPATTSKPQSTKSRDSQPKKENILIQESPKHKSSHDNLNKSSNCEQQKQEFQKNKSSSLSDNHQNNNTIANGSSSKIKENLKLAKEEFFKGGNNGANKDANNNSFKPSQELIKSSSNSHIYMNDQDPNYYKNLHKITKSLNNNVTNLIVSKPPQQQSNQSQQSNTQNPPIPLHKSVSNSSVPNYLGHHHHHHNFHHHPHHPQQVFFPPPAPGNFQPSSAPVHGPAFIYPAYPSTHDMQMIQKSNIPICYKYSLNKSSSNSSMGPASFGFYSLNEKPAFTTPTGIPVLWPQPTQSNQQPPHHNINKSSSSSCIYAKTLSQPAHLSKNNGIFSRYKPILSDDDDSDISDDDVSKHSNVSYVNNVPAPPPFNRKNSMPNSIMTVHSSSSNNSINNFTPFTKISTIQIPINGQLPPPFKTKNATLAMERQEDHQKSLNTVDNGNIVQKNVITENNHQQQQQYHHKNEIQSLPSSIVPSCTPQSHIQSQPQSTIAAAVIQANNIFYNLMSNPLTATQNAIAINQQNNMQLQQQKAKQQQQDGHPHSTGTFSSVGVIGGEQIYTPYTKYLSDRKYFADLNVCGESKVQSGTTTATTPSIEQQRRNSGTSTCTNNKSKIPMYIENKSKQIKEPPAVINSNHLHTQQQQMNKKEDDEIDILSAFDPYYVPTTESQQNQNISSTSSNKLHQLLSSVVNEQWTDYKKCDAYGSDHLFSSETAEVVSLLYIAIFSLLTSFAAWMELNYSFRLTYFLITIVI